MWNLLLKNFFDILYVCNTLSMNELRVNPDKYS